MRGVAGTVVCVALVSGATSTAAAPVHKKATAAPAAASAPALPAPSVKLDVAPVSAKRWTVRVENTGQVPLRLVADARLLSFEITPPAASSASSKRAKAPKPLVCALPADMRPSDDRERVLVLPPGKAYKDSFDPRLYCFSAKESAALVAGAEVVARYGFASKRSTKRGKRADAEPTPPFVVASARGDGEAAPPTAASTATDVGPLASIATAPWTLSDTAVAPTLPATPPVTRATTDVDAHLAVSMTPRVDAARAADAAATVTLANEDTRAANVYFRPQTIGFEVSGPRASAVPVTCAPSGAGAIRELYTHLGAHARTSTTVLIEPSCPDHTFDLPGLYEVRPLIDTRRVAGAPPNLPSFTGEVVGPPALVRIRRGSEAVATPPPMVE